MDIRLWPLAIHIADVEHMAVQLRAIHPLGKGVVNRVGWSFVRAASSNYLAKVWIEKRLEIKFPYLTGFIVDSSGRRLEDYESITLARDTPEVEVIYSNPLEISLSGKDSSNLHLFDPFFKDINAEIKPIAKKVWRDWWVKKVVIPPVVLWGFEYEKIKEYLYREAAANDIKVQLSRNKKDSKAHILNCLVFEDLLKALSKVTHIIPEKDNDHFSVEQRKGGIRAKSVRTFTPNFDRERVVLLCKGLIHGLRGVTLGKEILAQLDQGCLTKSTFIRLSRWVNPKKPEPFAQPIAAEISTLLFGKMIKRIPAD